MSYRIPEALIGEENARLAAAQAEDYAALGRRLGRAGVDIEAITARVAAFAVAVPTWGVGTGGTRFARFPGPGEPRGIFDKLEDCATIHQLTRATPTCSPHFPWDKVDDYRELAEFAAGLGVGFDAVNSNTFQDQPGQTLSYKFGSLSHSRHHLVVIPWRIAHQLLHRLIVALRDVFFDLPDVLSLLLTEQPAQVCLCVRAAVLASHNEELTEAF